MHIPSPASPSAFSKLHPSIQQAIRREGWESLRSIQVEAIHAILDRSNHLIISASTASGKTEAAFLPILSKIAEDYQNGVRVIYVGPLKALINDQFGRLELLCEQAEIPVHKWHGDVGSTQKAKLRKSPSGVLLITPESIESILINFSSLASSLFSKLSFIVIDEIHSFIGSERGVHLRSLISRLTKKSDEQVRRIGLSATLGSDKESVRRWLDWKEPESVELIEDSGRKKTALSVYGYIRPFKPVVMGIVQEEQEDSVHWKDESSSKIPKDLAHYFYGKTALVFANNKMTLESYTDEVNQILERQGKPHLFRVHHGSLSKAEREDAEESLRNSKLPIVTLCSSTLEMGIDIGNIQEVGQMDSPFSVASLAQRLGRSGRKEDEIPTLRMFIEEEEVTSNSTLVEQLYPNLLQSIAMVELMCEGWSEPLEADKFHLSTLVHQILSLIKENGGRRPDRLFKELIVHGAFENLNQQLFVKALKSLKDHDLIEQVDSSAGAEIILGLKGEIITKGFDFYCAFITSEEVRVLYKGSLIGTISYMPILSSKNNEEYLILAGRRWRIVSVDPNKKEAIVEPAKGRKLPRYESLIDENIHAKIRRKMIQLLQSKAPISYLDSTANLMLGQARKVALQAQLLHQPLIEHDKRWFWFPWSSSRVHRTLWALAKEADLIDKNEQGDLAETCDLAIIFEEKSTEKITQVFSQFLENMPTAFKLASLFTRKSREKYDEYLSDDLLNAVFAKNKLDLPGAQESIQEMLSSFAGSLTNVDVT